MSDDNEAIDEGGTLVQIERRADHLHAVAMGRVTSLSQLERCRRRVDRFAQASELDRALLDARGLVGEVEHDAADRFWGWLTEPERVVRRWALVLPRATEVAELNARAAAERASVRAFSTVQIARCWLLRDARQTATTASQPVAESEAPASGKRRKLSEGAYLLGDVAEERLRSNE